MPQAAYQLVVATVTVVPRDTASHPWRTTRRDGIATCERSPGPARDQSARPTRADIARAAAERDARVSAEVGSAREVGVRLGMSRMAILGCRFRHRQRGGTMPEAPPPAPRPARPAPTPRPRPVANVPAVPAPVVRMSLLDASPLQCRALDRDDGLCCAAPVVAGRSWCATHALAYLRRGYERRRAA